MLRKKFSLKQIYIGSALFGLVVHTLCYIVFAQDVTNVNIYLLWVFLFLMGIPLGIYNVITYALIADAAEQSGKPVEDFAKTLSEEDKKYFEDRAKVDSLFDMLMKEAKITVVEAKKEKKPAAKKAAPNKDTKKKDAEQKTE